MLRPETGRLRLDAGQLHSLKDSFEELRRLPFWIRKTKESDGYTWLSRSIGAPRFGDECMGDVPGRIRFIERWLKGGGGFTVGQAKVELQYIFPGESIYGELEGEELGLSQTEETATSYLMLEGAVNASSRLADRSVSRYYKINFFSDGTVSGFLRRRESEEAPYMVGLDSGVPVEDLQTFGTALATWQPQYATEPLSVSALVDLEHTVRCFSIIEATRITRLLDEAGV